MKLLSSYVYIPASNLLQSAEWYSKNFELNIVFEDPLFIELYSPTGVRIMLITNGDGITSHMNYPSGPQASYGFVVSDVEKLYRELREQGAPVRKMSEYQGKSFGVEDPDGNIIEFWSDHPR